MPTRPSLLATPARLTAAAALLLAAGAAAAQPTATFHPLPHGFANAVDAAATDISNDGATVVGYFADENFLYTGFIWTASGGATVFPSMCNTIPSSRFTRLSGNGLAATGEMNICGAPWFGCPFCGETGAGVWATGQGVSYIGYLPGGEPQDFDGSVGMGVSDDGNTVVGFSNAVDPLTFEPTVRPFRWTRAGGIQDIGLPLHGESGQAVGLTDDGASALIQAYIYTFDEEQEIDGSVARIFFWTEAGGFEEVPFTGLPADASGWTPVALSGDGAAFTGYTSTAGTTQAFVWRQGHGAQLLGARPDLGRNSSIPWAVNGDGTVVVGELLGGHPRIPFIWTAADGMRTVTEVLTAGGADLTGWQIRGVNSVSADGRTFVGYGTRQHPEFGQVGDAWIATLSGDTTPPACPADWNTDGTVNSTDLSAFITSWLASVQGNTLTADFNNDGQVNSTDLSAFITAWLHAVQHGC